MIIQLETRGCPNVYYDTETKKFSAIAKITIDKGDGLSEKIIVLEEMN